MEEAAPTRRQRWAPKDCPGHGSPSAPVDYQQHETAAIALPGSGAESISRQAKMRIDRRYRLRIGTATYLAK
jgi:hypothetical protein